MDLPGVGVKVIAVAAIFTRERSHPGATSPCAGSSAVESALLRPESSPHSMGSRVLPHSLPSDSWSLVETHSLWSPVLQPTAP